MAAVLAYDPSTNGPRRCPMRPDFDDETPCFRGDGETPQGVS